MERARGFPPRGDWLRLTEALDSEGSQFVKKFCEQGKPLAATCHGPWMLVGGGVVKGTHAHLLAVSTD